jgi:hypothetical protein
MAGLSATHFDSASISRTVSADGDIATATSGGTSSGRALSDVAHSSGGLRYAEIEVISLRNGTNSFGIGCVSSTANLSQWIGQGVDKGFYLRVSGNTMQAYLNGAMSTVHGQSIADVGMRWLVWLNPASRKMWLTTTDREGGRYGDGPNANPAAGTSESWVVPGTDPIRLAITPGYGSGGDANALRLRTRYTQLRGRGAELLGALPWDARESTITVNVSGVSDGTTLRWAWFDEPRPDLLTQPTSRGTVTVSGGAVSVTVSTSLDAGGIGTLLLSTTDGTVVQCRSNYMPAVAP